ncbi:Methyltransferase domain-containing protein [Arenibacter palladensis]|uniref:Methyltransferase domain-containing protein n=1 Tax=Arenibacter palladensis TaxID=237373 RepID=A0A1M5A2Q0_9FLAO|nr:class I SAM-dependent methyltransferase [Arenibacter palladensis]SHF24206.1 Methyltransferase domain-containing protein [Arenibacter palladensis]
MKKVAQTIFLFSTLLLWFPGIGQDKTPNANYTYKKGDSSGIGKWYMDREIAHVMGYQGMQWLDRPEREEEENTTALLMNMEIEPKDYIADIGAGSGYHVFKMAKLARNGLIYAVDIQDEMLEEINSRKERDHIKNVRVIKGGEKSINIAENSLDKILMVDVYHEFKYPAEMLASIKKALKAHGKLFLIEYRGEDKSVPIKKLHKMTEAQAIKEMKAAGMKLLRNIDNLPWQHCMVFVRN